MRNKKTTLVALLLVILFLAMLISGCKFSDSSKAISSCTNGFSPKPLDKEFNFPGTLLIQDRQGKTIYAIDGRSHEIITIKENILNTDTTIMSLSPDGRWIILYQPRISKQNTIDLQLISYDGQVEEKSIAINKLINDEINIESLWLILWRNSETLQGVTDDGSGGLSGEPKKIILINPFENEVSNIEEMYEIPDFAEDSGFSISPDLTRIIFFDNNYNLVLYDLLEAKMLWTYTKPNNIYRYEYTTYLDDIEWSASGDMFALPIANKEIDTQGIMVIDREGNIKNFSSFGHEPFELNWSHDRQQITFTSGRYNSIQGEDSLILLNLFQVNTGLYQDICFVQSDYDIRNIHWSPDDNYLAYGTRKYSSTESKVLIKKLDDSILREVILPEPELELLGWSEYKWNKPSE